MTTALQDAGDVRIEKLELISQQGNSLDISDYLAELNIYEDIFSNFMSGSIVLSDSANLIKSLPIVGQELLTVQITTPTFDKSIKKTFRVFSVTDRALVRDTTTQVYKLNFCSIEGFLDGVKPIYKTFDGTADKVVQEVFDEYVKYQDSSLNVLTSGKNKMKFNCPGWTPFQLINWISNKAQPTSGKACNFFFWESSQGFYFGSLETVFKAGTDSAAGLGEYTYSAIGNKELRDVDSKMRSIERLEIVQTNDYLTAHLSGYLGSRLISLDLIDKKYENKEYDHVKEFNNYSHLANKNRMRPLFGSDPIRNLRQSTRIYPKQTKLYEGADDNINEKMPEIYGNRLSNMIELTNFKINIIVPGRTDAEAGMLVKLKFPDARPAQEADKSKSQEDPMYSGNYLITAIHHKISPIRHGMTMELVRDSFNEEA